MKIKLVRGTILIGLLGFALTMLIASASPAQTGEEAVEKAPQERSFFDRLFGRDKPLEKREVIRVPSETQPKQVGPAESIKDLSKVKKFIMIKDFIALYKYCLNYFSFVPNPQQGTLCSFPGGEPGGTIGNKKIIGGYACIANPIPNEEDVCPTGTSIHYDNAGLYGCNSDATTPFQAICLPGYNLIQDYSQNKPNWAPNDYPYNIRCELSGFKQPTDYLDTSIPCGTSGALMSVGVGVMGLNEYCCVYLEE